MTLEQVLANLALTVAEEGARRRETEQRLAEAQALIAELERQNRSQEDR